MQQSAITLWILCLIWRRSTLCCTNSLKPNQTCALLDLWRCIWNQDISSRSLMSSRLCGGGLHVASLSHFLPCTTSYTEHRRPGVPQSCSFVNALTQLSSHYNLALVKVTHVLPLAHFSLFLTHRSWQNAPLMPDLLKPSDRSCENKIISLIHFTCWWS